jgi:hypothetical protein
VLDSYVLLNGAHSVKTSSTSQRTSEAFCFALQPGRHYVAMVKLSPQYPSDTDDAEDDDDDLKKRKTSPQDAEASGGRIVLLKYNKFPTHESDFKSGGFLNEAKACKSALKVRG